MASNLSNSAISRAGAGDRVLFLYIPPVGMLEELSARVGPGIIVCLGGRDAVYEARKAGRHLPNAMFVAADLDEIPWQEGFFNWVLEDGAPAQPAVYREIVRVLAPGGALVAGSLDRDLFAAAGLTEDDGALRKPAAPQEASAPDPFPILG